ncbi:12393_t:CDS:2 [Cetraspora pellucida]|uniref:12393_t:CDS:1 n=1 Tax=Cetraspora pellucida TaxID=1433469 RepID=A0A9N9HYV6_9GLOM|nr:12393_t:CDS:2 [Cetraspora pellucida]
MRWIEHTSIKTSKDSAMKRCLNLELILKLEETEQHQSYQKILQILIEEESTSQELIKAIKEIQQSSKERFDKEETDKQLKFTEIVKGTTRKQDITKILHSVYNQFYKKEKKINNSHIKT